MVLAASGDGPGIFLLSPDEGAQPGMRVKMSERRGVAMVPVPYAQRLRDSPLVIRQPLARHRRDRGVARHRRARPGVAAPTLCQSPLFPAGRRSALALAGVALVSIGALPQSTVLPLGLPDLPFHLRLDALSAFFLLLLGAAARASRSSPPATSARARARRRACCACNTTCSSPRWRWCCSPTTPTPSWWRGRRWRCRRTSWSPPTTAFPRSAAPASSTC